MEDIRIVSEKRLANLKTDLEGKKQFLDQLLIYIENQHKKLEDTEPDMKQVDKVLQEKERMYMKIDKVDVRINGHLSQLAEIDGISQMHPELAGQVKEVMLQIKNLGDIIHKRELVCRDLIQKVFTDKKDSVKSFRQTKGAMSQYNKTMGNAPQNGASFFMDKKK